MKKFLGFALLISSCCFAHIPHRPVGQSEIIGNMRYGIMVPLADCSFVSAHYDRGSPSLSYKSRLFPRADLFFYCNSFDVPMNLDSYADWFTQRDYGFFPQKSRSYVLGGIHRSISIVTQRWENNDCVYHQLFFGEGREGFACTLYLPKPYDWGEGSYWDFFFENLAYEIELGGS